MRCAYSPFLSSAAAILILLSAATSVAWVIGYRHNLEVGFQLSRSSDWQISSRSGSLVIDGHNDIPGPLGGWAFFAPNGKRTYRGSHIFYLERISGYRWRQGTPDSGVVPGSLPPLKPTDWSGQFRIEYWFLDVVLLVFPTWWMIRFWLQRRARCSAKGLCPECGYDIRATPHRCPECGATLQARNADAGTKQETQVVVYFINLGSQMGIVTRLCLCVVTMLLSSVRCTGAVLSLDASGKGFWDDHAVIFAQVTEMRQADGITTLQLQIIAVELTTLPITVEGFIAKGALNAPESAIHADVTKGSFVLCCVDYSSDG